jgi:hypothetical protein
MARRARSRHPISGRHGPRAMAAHPAAMVDHRVQSIEAEWNLQALCQARSDAKTQTEVAARRVGYDPSVDPGYSGPTARAGMLAPVRGRPAALLLGVAALSLACDPRC